MLIQALFADKLSTGASDGIRGLPVSTSEQEHCRPDITLVSRGQTLLPHPVYNNHYDRKKEINSLVMNEPTGRFVITARGRSANMPNSSTSPHSDRQLCCLWYTTYGIFTWRNNSCLTP
ncbi:hypothetical protein An03g01380 [Aspergillus niger]|uniref:Uncharacterized protein n=2 Tax=Aspergillus niger TaxID=5061 RepID=A2QG01_ASPNC|nr:hypothetical protein An03g01380 [Aspergillus niger]CAK38111.1 hypothetical protein An03g01380 [Aspergillus niger]